MRDGSGGYVLTLLTDSFAVRAFVGTLAASCLSLLVVRVGRPHTARARRLLVMAPVVVVVVAALASAGGQFLPTVGALSVDPTTVPEGRSVEVLADATAPIVTSQRNWLVGVYVLVAGALLSRRLVGALGLRRLLRGSRALDDDDPALSIVGRLAADLGVRTPEVRVVDGCPGGAFAAGRRRAVVALDPVFMASLDAAELEGLLAHELAHLRRGDPTAALLVGVVRDVAFFLPGVNAAVRWLRHEQEEGADELAARATGRPAALASGILKIWRGGPTAAPSAACTAVRPPRRPVLDRQGGPGARLWLPGPLRRAWSAPSGRVSAAVAVVTPWPTDARAVVRQRVERLIEHTPRPTARRRRTEVVAGVVVTVVAVVAGLLAPSWLSQRHTELLGVFYLTTSSTVSGDSPAFATFKELAEQHAAGAGLPSVVGSTVGPRDPVSAGEDAAAALARRDREMARTCPCVATPSQLAAGVSPAPTLPAGMAWGADPWRLQHLHNRSEMETTRRLMLLDSNDQQLGLLTAGSRSPVGDGGLEGVGGVGALR